MSTISDAKEALHRLNKASHDAFEETMKVAGEVAFERAYAFSIELESWRNALARRPERVIFDTAQSEFYISTLNASQGQYRNAFKGLRLVLELYLQGCLLSTDVIALKEWLSSSRDTSWAQIKGDSGIFSSRYVSQLFPSLTRAAGGFQGTAIKLYKELSECIHGNFSTAIPLPDQIAFSGDALNLWIEKSELVRLLVHFSLTVRYITELQPQESSALEPMIMDTLGTLPEIRVAFGGRAE